MERGKVSAPDDLQVGKSGFQLSRDRNCLKQLRPGHDRDPEILQRPPLSPLFEMAQCILVQVLVKDLVWIFVLQRGSEIHKRERKPMLPASARRVEECDHENEESESEVIPSGLDVSRILAR